MTTDATAGILATPHAPRRGNSLTAAVAIGLVLTAGILWSCAPSGDSDTTPRVRGRLDYQGIDLSSHQGLVDWNKVAADTNVHFAYIKATEGATYHSVHYDYNVRHARLNGILVGSYHFFSTTSSVASQVENFTSHARPESQDLLPMIDVERIGQLTRRQLQDSVMLMARQLEAVYGHRPVIYSTLEFYNTYLVPQFNSFPLYIGRYATVEPEIHWQGNYTVWQFSEQGVVPGIERYVDLCRLRPGVTLNDLRLHPAARR